MTRKVTEPKATWSCDRCATTVDTKIDAGLPADWRHWEAFNDMSASVRAWHLCPRCSATVWAATEMPR